MEIKGLAVLCAGVLYDFTPLDDIIDMTAEQWLRNYIRAIRPIEFNTKELMREYAKDFRVRHATLTVEDAPGGGVMTSEDMKNVGCMTESLDHMKGRLDALFDEAKRLRVELEGREGERVYPDICTVCGGIIPIGCHEVHMRKHKMAQQQPVTERFVRVTATLIAPDAWRLTDRDGAVVTISSGQYTFLKYKLNAFGEMLDRGIVE